MHILPTMISHIIYHQTFSYLFFRSSFPHFIWFPLYQQ